MSVSKFKSDTPVSIDPDRPASLPCAFQRVEGENLEYPCRRSFALCREPPAAFVAVLNDEAGSPHGFQFRKTFEDLYAETT